MLKIYLNKNEECDILNGFPWVYNNEVNRFEGNIKSGEVVSVYSYEGNFVAYGFLNTSSKIFVRILSLNEKDVINKDFFEERIKQAIELRTTIDNSSNCCRLIFSEADFLPGLIVDKYADYLVCSFSCLGMDLIKKDIVDVLVKLLNPKGIYERSDIAVREKEGLELTKGFLYKEFDTKVLVKENNLSFYVDIENGQKTGYFLDQKYNRDNLRYYAKDKTVLDCFSNIGGFALHALKYGAKEVYAADISELACKQIEENAKLNHFDNIKVLCDDIFNILDKEEYQNKFDLIVLDPPAFTKDKDSVKNAYKGYKHINLKALKMIKKGGYLFTFSCSQHMTSDLFMQMLKEAAVDSKRQIQMLDFRIQSHDHPTLLSSKEQLYLKCVILRVL